MALKPTSFPDWTTDNPSNMVAPSGAEVRSGYVSGQPLTAEKYNYMAHLQGEWVRWLSDAQMASALVSTQEPSVRLLGGGAWSYSLSSRTLSWAAPAFVSYPGLADAANTVPASSVTLPAGSVAFVTTNAPFATTATVASGSATLTDVANAEQVRVGWQVSGSGIPAGATVSAVDAADQSITISAAATAPGSGVTVSFAGSGSLTVQALPVESYTASANSVVIARAFDTGCYVGVGSGQMRMHDAETKHLLDGGYLDVQRVTAGAALTAGQAVYISPGFADSGAQPSQQRVVGQAYVATPTYLFPARANVVGICLTTCAAGATAQIVTQGLVPLFSGLTPGSPYYLSAANDGSLTATAPTGINAMVTQVGIAATSTALLLGSPGSRTVRRLGGTKMPQQVFMGALHRTKPASSATYDRQPFGIIADDGTMIPRLWNTGMAGSLLQVKIFSHTPLPSSVTLTVYSGIDPKNNLMWSGTNAPYGDGSGAQGYGLWFQTDLGAYPFNAFANLGVALSCTTTLALNVQAEIVVDTQTF